MIKAIISPNPGFTSPGYMGIKVIGVEKKFKFD
jgi:hypothetical protein